MYFFYLTEQHSKFLLHTLQVPYMCTLCDSTNINTIIEFVPHVSGGGFSGGSDSYLQFTVQYTYRAPVRYVSKTRSVVLWNKKNILLSQVYCVWQVVKTQTTILNNPVLSTSGASSINHMFRPPIDHHQVVFNLSSNYTIYMVYSVGTRSHLQ